MAKDPAFLFYPGDWQGGTSTFSRFLKGCYMDVLIAQFNSGHLSLDEIKTVLGSDFGTAWPTLQKKFIADQKGLLFNEKLENEIIKRRLYSESRRKNREKKTHDTTHDKHMIRHVESENGNETDFKIKKESSKKVSPESLDERLGIALDDLYVDKQRMVWRHVDFNLELFAFIEKVRGSPEDYAGHDTGGLRKAFIYQLKGAKKIPHGKSKHDRTQQNANDIAIILQHASGGEGTQ